LGVKQDYAEALKWYRLAADKGSPAAECSLGFMYDKGQGVKADHAEAVKWYRLAADQDNAEAQKRLGIKYALGEGVPKDYVQAYLWFDLASSSRHDAPDTTAAKLRDAVSLGLTQEQIAEAQKLAEEWTPK
jgi:uncharacterized protein